MAKGHKNSHKDFLRRLINEYPNYKDVEILDEYVSYCNKISCKCRLCGNVWITTPKQLLQNKQKCPKCSKQSPQLTNKEFLDRVKANNPHFSKFIFLSDYKNMSTKIRLQCNACGHIWETRPFDLASKGIDCPSCSGNTTATHIAFIQRFKQKNKDFKKIKLLSEYCGSLKRIDCECNVCGHRWSPLATSLLQGSGCPECAKKRIASTNVKYLKKSRSINPAIIPMTNDEFVTKFFKKNHNAKDIELLSQYNGAKNKIKCKCKKCGCEWNTSPSTLLQGSGCPECAHTSTSFMEQFVYKSFLTFLDNVEVINRDKIIIGKELDVVVPSLKIAVEIGSWKWHKDVFKNDLLKQQLCDEKGITLFIIYDGFKKNKNIIDNNENLYVYPFDLSNEKDYVSLKNLIRTILARCGKFSIDENKWSEITEYSYKHSQRVDFDEFLQRFKKNNQNFDNIEIIGPYTKLANKIKCRCKTCGHVWEPIAFDLLRRNTGCIICRNKNKSHRVGHKSAKRKCDLILEWKSEHPKGNKKQCHEDTGISYVTVLKWWDEKNK